MSNLNDGMIGRSVVSFGNASAQDRDDILDCLALAEGGANRTCKASENFLLWMSVYRRCLEERDFSLMVPAIHDTRIVLSAKDFNTAFYKVIDQAGLRAVAMQAKAMFDAMGAAQFVERFFDNGEHGSAAVNFQVLPYAQVANGELLLFVCGIGLSGRANGRDQQTWSGEHRELIVRISCAAYSLDLGVYASVHREAVRRAVGERARRDILRLGV